MTRNITITITPAEWRIWPWYRRVVEPGKLWIGPIVIRWWRS